MSDEEGGFNADPALNNLAKSEKTKKRNFNSSQSRNKNISSILPSSVDPKYLYVFSKRIVRIEYPGLVQNINNALETLGGMHGVQMAVADHRNKLDLHFHPANKFSKGCSADKDLNPGILIKIKEKSVNQNGLQSDKYDYEVIGITSLNFKFNRICDYQYIPLVPTNNDGIETDVEYIYEKILPNNLPSLQWFLSKECLEQPKFFIPTNFARFDSSQSKLYLHAGEKFGSDVRPEISKCIENNKPQKRSKHISTKQMSIFVNFQIPNVQIPDQPLAYTMGLMHEKNLEEKYVLVKKLFEERPIWTKVAIQYKTGINTDNAKILLPTVAYFCPIGPWRMTWIRYEYNPQKDFNSRLYQTLDYRIRATEGLKLKVNAKRSYTSKTLFYVAPNNVKKVSLKDTIVSSNKDVIEERSYVLRPTYIPPARQMFYQYCDILIPEIQEMISRLPKLPLGAKCDPKNGWFPVNFTEQCREIVNKHVMNRVQEELLEDTLKLQQDSEKEMTHEASTTYCSKMLNNIKKGIYKSVNITSINESSGSDAEESVSVVDTVNLIDEMDEYRLEQVNADDFVNSIPERMEENSDDEHLSQTSDLDIDMEAVEEVNKMIAGIHEDDGDGFTSYLTKTTLT